MAKTTDSQAILQAFRDNDRLGARKVFNKVMAERASVELTKMQQTVAKQLQECARCGNPDALHEEEDDKDDTNAGHKPSIPGKFPKAQVKRVQWGSGKDGSPKKPAIHESSDDKTVPITKEMDEVRNTI